MLVWFKTAVAVALRILCLGRHCCHIGTSTDQVLDPLHVSQSETKHPSIRWMDHYGPGWHRGSARAWLARDVQYGKPSRQNPEAITKPSCRVVVIFKDFLWELQVLQSWISWIILASWVLSFCPKAHDAYCHHEVQVILDGVSAPLQELETSGSFESQAEPTNHSWIVQSACCSTLCVAPSCSILTYFDLILYPSLFTKQ